MDIAYLATPFLTWLLAGSLKFIINSLRSGRPAFGLIGYGGLPSNHSAIVSSMAVLIGLREGIGHPAFGVATTLAFIVMLDASSLRRQVGKHAAALNRLRHIDGAAVNPAPLRERMGHSALEIAAGVATGALAAVAVHAFA